MANWRKTKLPHRPKLNLYAYALSMMSSHDLDCNNLIVGFARTGKSTLALELTILINSYRLGVTPEEAERLLIEKKFCENNIFYSDTQNIENMLKTREKEVFIADEGYLSADRRLSMGTQNIQLSGTINAFANKNHIFFTLIQNLSDLDSRWTAKANSIILITERGKALLFSREKNFALLKDYYGFENYLSKPWLLSGYDAGMYSLKRLPSFICELDWEKLEGHPFYNDYLEHKIGWQSQIRNAPKKLIDQINAQIAEDKRSRIDKFLLSNKTDLNL